MWVGAGWGELTLLPSPFLYVVTNEAKYMVFNDFGNHICEREVGSLRREL